MGDIHLRVVDKAFPNVLRHQVEKARHGMDASKVVLSSRSLTGSMRTSFYLFNTTEHI